MMLTQIDDIHVFDIRSASGGSEARGSTTTTSTDSSPTTRTCWETPASTFRSEAASPGNPEVRTFIRRGGKHWGNIYTVSLMFIFMSQTSLSGCRAREICPG